jgi:transcription termination/antitermination protein NusA
LAIGRRGQNVRLASKLVGWDIEIMTHDELNEGIEKAENWFRQIPNVTDELVEAFIEEGFLSYDDLTFLEPAQLAELAGITEEQAEEVIAFAEEGSERVEEETRLAKEAEAEARAQAPATDSAARPAASPTAADLFASEEPAPATDTKPTLESLFGPDVTDKPDETLSAEQVFGNAAGSGDNQAEAKEDE